MNKLMLLVFFIAGTQQRVLARAGLGPKLDNR